MDNNKTFIDPLDEIMKKHSDAAGINNDPVISDDVPDELPISSSEDVMDKDIPSVVDESVEEDIYGEGDLQRQIEEEKKAAEDEKALAREKAYLDFLESRKTLEDMPPNSLDVEVQLKAVDFQADKKTTVAEMIKYVLDKHNITTGGVPEYDDNGVPVQFQLRGDLEERYHLDGKTITPEFESLLLSNWIMPDGMSAVQYIKNQKDKPTDADNDSPENTVDDPEIAEETQPNPVINISVEKGAPVTVNVDSSIIPNTTKNNVIDIYVKEVAEHELKATTIIENSNIDGIIQPYDSGLYDTPITLSYSGYRCVMRPINWFDFIKLSAPSSNSLTDTELQKWSVIYKHMKNVSIGEFKDFDDFLKNTKYNDKELLMWAILVATADEEEDLPIKCGNELCQKNTTIKYRPRQIIHLDESKIPAHYTKTYTAAVGKEARDHFDEICNRRRRYQLPNSKIIVEINEPSVYDFITQKLPTVQMLYKRYRPDDEDMSKLDPNDHTMIEFDYLSANALLISAMTVIKDDKEYRYTNWEAIENIITEVLDSEDSAILLKLVETARADVSPVSFYVPDVTCPACQLKTDKIEINDIGTTLLFRVSRRLSSTTINLIEMD